MLLAVVPPHLSVLPVRGGEEDRGRGQGDQEDPQAAEEEGEEGDQSPPAGSVTARWQSTIAPNVFITVSRGDIFFWGGMPVKSDKGTPRVQTETARPVW